MKRNEKKRKEKEFYVPQRNSTARRNRKDDASCRCLFPPLLPPPPDDEPNKMHNATYNFLDSHTHCVWMCDIQLLLYFHFIADTRGAQLVRQRTYLATRNRYNYFFTSENMVQVVSFSRLLLLLLNFFCGGKSDEDHVAASNIQTNRLLKQYTHTPTEGDKRKSFLKDYKTGPSRTVLYCTVPDRTEQEHFAVFFSSPSTVPPVPSLTPYTNTCLSFIIRFLSSSSLFFS
jgi:hypothetical protein